MSISIHSRGLRNRRRLAIELCERRYLLAGDDGIFGIGDPPNDNSPAEESSPGSFGPGSNGPGSEGPSSGGPSSGGPGNTDPIDPNPDGSDPDGPGSGDPGGDVPGGGTGSDPGVPDFSKFDWQIEAVMESTASGAQPDLDPSDSGFIAHPFDPRLYDESTSEIRFFADLSQMDSPLVDQITDLGISIDINALNFMPNGEANFIEGRGTADELINLTALDKVQKIRGVSFAIHQNHEDREGQIVSEGDDILRAHDLRAALEPFGIDGSGVNIGVTSDGVQSRSQIPVDELPASLTVLGNTGGDEGTAIIEIIHDLAPGADVFFAGGNTVGEYIAGLRWLAERSDVIVDDTLFTDEPYFTDGRVATTIRDIIQQGVTYVAAGGNFGEGHYQSEWTPVAVAGNQDSYHAFEIVDNQTVDLTLNVRIPGNSTARFFVQWSDPWEESSANDFFLQVERPAQPPVFSFPSQSGDDFPHDVLILENTQDEPNDIPVFLGLRADDPAIARLIKIFVLGGTITDHNTDQNASVSKAAVEEAIVVATVNANDPGHNDVASYSSPGGALIATDFSSQTFTSRETVDIAGIDRVLTSAGQQGIFPPGAGGSENYFSGTSAATPHIGAIAALLLQIDPDLAPAQVSDALRNNATDIGAPNYDRFSGAGRADALESGFAVLQLDAPDLVESSDTGESNEDNVTTDVSPTFTGTAPIGSLVQIYAGDQLIGTQQMVGENSTYNITTSLLAGIHAISATATSQAGTESVRSPSTIVQVRTSLPSFAGSIDLLPGSDGGPSKTDNITNVRSPIFNVSGANPRLRLYRIDDSDGQFERVILRDFVNNGNLTLAIQTDGAQTYRLHAVDIAGNESITFAQIEATYDFTPPAIPLRLDLLPESDSGVSSSDNITNKSVLSFAPIDAAIYRVLRGNRRITDEFQTGVFEDRNAGDGVHTYIAYAIDNAGNASPPSQSLTVTVDRVAPTANISRVTPDPRTTSVASIATHFSEPNLVGLSPNAFELFRDGSANLLTETQTFSYSGQTATVSELETLTGGLGTYTYTFDRSAVQDTAGNAVSVNGVQSDTWQVVERAVPDPPDLSAESDSGVHSFDNITKDATPTFQGTAPAGATVRLYANEILRGQTTLSTQSTHYSITSSFLTDDTYQVRVAFIESGETIESTRSTPLTVTIDTIAPPEPPRPDLVASSDTGFSNSDNITYADSLEFGFGDAPYHRVYRFNPLEQLSSDYHEGNFVHQSAIEGPLRRFWVQAVDVAGNVSSGGDRLVVNVDRTNPTFQIEPISPNATSRDVDSIDIVFSEADLNGLDLSDFTLTRDEGDNLLTSSQSLTIADQTATISGLSDLTGTLGSYRIELNSVGIADRAGNELATGNAMTWERVEANLHNPRRATDVNDDGHVSAIDAMLVVSALNNIGTGPVSQFPEAIPGAGSYLDVSDDKNVSAIDALIVINELNARLDGEGETSPDYYGAIGQLSLPGESVDGIRNYEFHVENDGLLSAEVTFAHFGGNIDLRLYEINKPRLIATSSSQTNNEQIQVEVVAGRRYLLQVLGTNDSYQSDLQLETAMPSI